MKVRCLVRFNDAKAKCKRHPGEEFVVSKARYAEIVAVRADLVEPVEAPAKGEKK